MAKVLVTGGTGYIGSHTVLALMQAGHEIVVIDNLSNSTEESLARIASFAAQRIEFLKVDLCEKKQLVEVFRNHQFDAVIHFAGLKSVSESINYPYKYYRNNIFGTLVLLGCMKEFGVKKIIFSSSATVYGTPLTLPIPEEHKTIPNNPYGISKLAVEQVLQKTYKENKNWSIINLRYFNPIGAHSSGIVGEKNTQVSSNIMPLLIKVARGDVSHFKIFGNNYSTKDGTGIRDYIHVCDVADGHISALNLILNEKCFNTFNLGTGRGYSVLELIKEFENATNKKIPYVFEGRRKGDVESAYADASSAKNILGWSAKRTIYEACIDAWVWGEREIKDF